MTDGDAANETLEDGDDGMGQACRVEGEDGQEVFGKHGEDGVEDVYWMGVATYVVHCIT